MSEAAALFFSIKPKYAEKILTGEKTVELRRTRPRAKAGSPILIYASSPRRSLLGVVFVTRIMEAAPSRLWPKIRKLAGVTKVEFDSYFAGAHKAIAIFMERVISFPEPVDLEDLRVLIPHFRPPQSYSYLRHGDPHAALLLERLDSDAATA